MIQAAASSPSCYRSSFVRKVPRHKLKVMNPKWQGHALNDGELKSLRSIVKSQMMDPSTLSSRITTNLQIPLSEVPGASFDQYLEDKPRVFKAIFPDKHSSQQLNEEEWRVHMLPIEFMFLSACPVIYIRLRCKSKGKDEYPSGVPHDTTKVLELDIIKWELHGVSSSLKPSQFTLGVKGALYPERRGPRARIKGQLQMSISFVPPAVLAMVPEDVRREVAEMVLRKLADKMTHKVTGSLLADYSKFKREKPKKNFRS